MAGHRAALLRHPELIDRREMVSLDMRAHGQHCSNGHDAGTADASDQNAVWLARFEGRSIRFWDSGEQLARCRFQTLWSSAKDGDEARAEAFDAGKVLVAGRLVDLPLAPESRVERCH